MLHQTVTADCVNHSSHGWGKPILKECREHLSTRARSAVRRLSARKCMYCISGKTSGKSDVLTSIVEQMAMPNTSYAWHCHSNQHRRQR